jgi:hypothetical protein
VQLASLSQIRPVKLSVHRTLASRKSRGGPGDAFFEGAVVAGKIGFVRPGPGHRGPQPHQVIDRI